MIPPKSTRSENGDAKLTTLIDPFLFLEDLFGEEPLDEEAPDEGQCQ
jgi:hypothetical protein